MCSPFSINDQSSDFTKLGDRLDVVADTKAGEANHPALGYGEDHPLIRIASNESYSVQCLSDGHLMLRQVAKEPRNRRGIRIGSASYSNGNA